jgi:hypothetical protein
MLRRVTTLGDEKGELVTDSHSILARWRNHYPQLFNVHGVSDVRQTHTAEPKVREPSAFKDELSIEKIKDTNHQVLIKSQQY